MVTELQQALIDLVTEGGPIELTSRYAGETAREGWMHDKWRVVLSYGGRSYVTTYHTGLCRRCRVTNAVNPPVLADVLGSCLSDASCVDGLTFEQWASDLGYNTDSRNAFATYEACLATRAELTRLIGTELLERLTRLEH